jgi:hypothetical protein
MRTHYCRLTDLAECVLYHSSVCGDCINICCIMVMVVRTSRLLYRSICEDYMKVCCSTVVSGRTVCKEDSMYINVS